MSPQEFDEAITMLRSQDSMTFEEGFHWLIGHVDSFLPQLTELMRAESEPSMRGKLVEVLGHGSNECIIPVLKSELNSPHSEVRCWAYSQLSYFEHPKATEIAEKYKVEHPNEEWL